MTQASNPANLMMESVHAVAYGGGLGQPLVATPAALTHINGDALAHFVQANYCASNVVLAASGVAHEAGDTSPIHSRPPPRPRVMAHRRLLFFTRLLLFQAPRRHRYLDPSYRSRVLYISTSV